MAKRLQEYVKYTTEELECYTKTDGSCIYKVNSNLHLSLGPYCLADFKRTLATHIIRRKVGYYDSSLGGIVLDIKNLKVLGSTAALRADDPRFHVDVNADCYVFRPVAGSILSGVVKHVGSSQIGVIIYRVFNVSIRFEGKISKGAVQMDDTMQFRIKNYDLQTMFPYIEGDLVTLNGEGIVNAYIKSEGENTDNALDSGIEERESHDLNELELLIKKEDVSEEEKEGDALLKTITKKRKSSKETRRKCKASEDSGVSQTTIKLESGAKKKKKERN